MGNQRTLYVVYLKKGVFSFFQKRRRSNTTKTLPPLLSWPRRHTEHAAPHCRAWPQLPQRWPRLGSGAPGLPLGPLGLLEIQPCGNMEMNENGLPVFRSARSLQYLVAKNGEATTKMMENGGRRTCGEKTSTKSDWKFGKLFPAAWYEVLKQWMWHYQQELCFSRCCLIRDQEAPAGLLQHVFVNFACC